MDRKRQRKTSVGESVTAFPLITFYELVHGCGTIFIYCMDKIVLTRQYLYCHCNGGGLGTKIVREHSIITKIAVVLLQMFLERRNAFNRFIFVFDRNCSL